MFGSRKEAFADASIWIDIADPSTYSLSGSTFTAFSNKGTRGGSFSINGSPTITGDMAMLHDHISEWLRWTGSIARPFTIFAVWQGTASDTLNHYLWGTPNTNRDEFRYGNALTPPYKSNYFPIATTNMLNEYNASTKGAICVAQKASDHDVYSKYTVVPKAGTGVPPNTSLDHINILSGRSGFEESAGTVKLWEFALYESTLTPAVILNKQAKMVAKHNL